MEKEYLCPVEGFELVSAEASNDQIQELVGMDFSIFTNTIIFAQNTRGKSVVDFLDEDDAGQKEIFSTLFHLKGYEQARDLILPDLKGTEIKINENERDLGTVETKLSSKQEELTGVLRLEVMFQEEKYKKTLENEVLIKDLNEQLRKANPEQRTKEFLELRNKIAKEEELLKSLTEEEKKVRDTYTISNTTLSFKKDELLHHTNVVQLGIAEPQKPEFDIDQCRASKEVAEENLKELRAFKSQKQKERDDFAFKFRNANAACSTRAKQLQEAEAVQKEVEAKRSRLITKVESISVCPACKQEFATPEAKENALKDLHEQLLSCVDLDLSSYKELLESSQETLENVEATKFDQVMYDKIVDSINTFEKNLETAQAEIQIFEAYERDVLVYKTKLKSIEEAKEKRQQTTAILQVEILELEPKLPGLLNLAAAAQVKCVDQQNELDRSREDYTKLHARIEAEILPLEKQLNQACASLTQAQQSVFPQEQWLHSTRTVLASLSKEKEERLDAEVALKKQAKVLEDLEEAFSKEGIVAELFKEYIPDIESLAQNYLAELTNNELEIHFRLEKELKKKVKGIAEVRNQFEIEVKKKNGGSAYDLISGSEQNKAALVVNLALSDLAYQHSNVSCNIRSYDEIFDGLDARSAERLSNLLINKFQDENRITFVVTHKTELDDSFPYKIVLRKENGVSRIQEVVE